MCFELSFFFAVYVTVSVFTYIFMTILPQILDVFLPLNESRSREHPFHAEFFIDNEEYFYLIRFQIYVVLLLVLEIVVANGSIFIVTCTTPVDCLPY